MQVVGSEADILTAVSNPKRVLREWITAKALEVLHRGPISMDHHFPICYQPTLLIGISLRSTYAQA